MQIINVELKNNDKDDKVHQYFVSLKLSGYMLGSFFRDLLNNTVIMDWSQAPSKLRQF